MVAVLGFIDGFGADTQVIGIYKNLEDAVYFHGDNFQYIQGNQNIHTQTGLFPAHTMYLRIHYKSP